MIQQNNHEEKLFRVWNFISNTSDLNSYGLEITASCSTIYKANIVVKSYIVKSSEQSFKISLEGDKRITARLISKDEEYVVDPIRIHYDSLYKIMDPIMRSYKVNTIID